MATRAKKLIVKKRLTIESMSFALNDLAKRLRKEMQKSELVSKVREGDPKRFPRLRDKVKKVTEFEQTMRGSLIYVQH